MRSPQRFVPCSLLACAGLALLSGCPGMLPDPGVDPTDSATDSAGSDTSDGADSTGTPGECTPLTQADVDQDATLPAGCYAVGQLLTLEHRLDIEAGAELYFDATAGLWVATDGILVAAGTTTDPVLMTAATDEGWLGLQWLGSSSSDNRLEHVRLEDPADIGVLLSPSSRLQVLDCEIVGAPSVGLEAAPGAELSVSATQFEGNGIPLHVGIDSVVGISGDNLLTDNDEAIVQVESGTLTDDASWVDPGVPLRMTGHAFIDAALTLDAGLTLQMPQTSQVVVGIAGSLTAVGTAEDPVVMQGVQDERGYWTGLSVESNDGANVLQHCIIENGGAEQWNGSDESVAMIWLPDQARLQVSDCTLRGSGGAALTSFGGADISGFAGNVIEDNRQTVKVSPPMAGSIEPSNTFPGNDEAYVRVGRPNTNNEAIQAPATWEALEIPYRVIDRFYVESDLTIAAGTTIEVMQDREIIVEPGGSLSAVGSARAPIAFVGAETVPGYWKGLQLLSVSGDNVLQHVQIRHAGSSGFNGNDDSDGALFIDGSASLTDATISESGGHGVVVWDHGQLLGCGNVSFADNAKTDVFVYGSGSSMCP